jgi:glycosyltransferase involved in cell wall biosynthesis
MTQNKYTFHMVGLYHLPAKKKYLPCAFTQKIVKLASMLKSLGHTVIFYGAEGSELEADEIVITHTLKDIRDSYGDGDNRFEIGYDWTKGKTFRFDEVEPLSEVHKKWIANTITEINKRKKDGDFLLQPQGGKSWRQISEAVNIPLTCETGIGYHETHARFRAFESNSVRSFIHGMEYGKNKSVNYDGKMTDRVIPNYWEDSDYTDDLLKLPKEDYFLYIGRTIPKKGIKIAQRVSQKLGKKLKIVGQLTEGFDLEGAEYLGVINDPKTKTELIAKALAVFTPSTYLEPFAGTSVEAQLCGTPALTTDFGVFPETINNVHSYRCNTFKDFVRKAKWCITASSNSHYRKRVKENANKYLTSNVKFMYQEWFNYLYKFVDKVMKTRDPEAWFNID